MSVAADKVGKFACCISETTEWFPMKFCSGRV